MIPTKPRAWRTGYLCSRAVPEKSKRKFGWICRAQETSPIRSSPNLPAASCPSWNREPKHEPDERQKFAVLRSGLLRSPVFRLAIALHLWGDPGLSVSLSLPSCRAIVGARPRGPVVAVPRSHLGADGGGLFGSCSRGIADRVAHGDQPDRQQLPEIAVSGIANVAHGRVGASIVAFVRSQKRRHLFCHSDERDAGSGDCDFRWHSTNPAYLHPRRKNSGNLTCCDAP